MARLQPTRLHERRCGSAVLMQFGRQVNETGGYREPGSVHAVDVGTPDHDRNGSQRFTYGTQQFVVQRAATGQQCGRRFLESLQAPVRCSRRPGLLLDGQPQAAPFPRRPACWRTGRVSTALVHRRPIASAGAGPSRQPPPVLFMRDVRSLDADGRRAFDPFSRCAWDVEHPRDRDRDGLPARRRDVARSPPMRSIVPPPISHHGVRRQSRRCLYHAPRRAGFGRDGAGRASSPSRPSVSTASAT